MKKIILCMVFLTILALGLRFYRIADVPASLNWDEAAFGYNAYSLLLTGKDEYGKIMPLQFLSVGDYKCPLYIYLLVPIIKILGLNEFAVRFVPSLLGALTIPLIFIITKVLFRSNRIGMLAGLSLAISPWHLQFTRAGADVAVSSFLLILGIALALKKRYVTAGISLGLTFYTYFGERAFTPLILLLLIWYLAGKSKQLLVAFGLTVLPLLLVLASSGHLNKVSNTTLLGYSASDEWTNNTKKEDYSGLVYFAFHNIFIEKTKMIVSRYANHFSTSFLFLYGPEDGRQRVDGMGMLYRSDIVLLLMFVAWAIKAKNNKSLWFLAVWLLISPLPAAITRDPVHARRAFNMVYPLAIMAGLGANYLWENKRKYLPAGLLYIALLIWSASFYYFSYYIFTPRTTYIGSAGWQYGYKELIASIANIENNSTRVVVDTSYQGPYIFFLFYQKYSPSKYQLQAKLNRPSEYALGEGAGYDNYEFRNIYWPVDRGTKSRLYAAPPERIPLKDIDPKQAKLVKTLYFPDGSEAWRIVDTVKE